MSKKRYLEEGAGGFYQLAAASQPVVPASIPLSAQTNLQNGLAKHLLRTTEVEGSLIVCRHDLRVRVCN
jgi:hypothetical protein